MIELLGSISGRISIEGHTDDIPINTPLFPSNWDLSTARALEVAHGLFDDSPLPQNRFSVAGFADTKPLVPNTSPESRAKNRRVEIVLQEKTDNEVKQEIVEEHETVIEDDQNAEIKRIFELDPIEIF